MKVISLIMLSLLVGCASMNLEPDSLRPLTASIYIKNMDREESKRVVDASYDALGKLYNCQYFIENYPKNYDMLFTKVMIDGFIIKKVPYDEFEAVRIKNSWGAITAFADPNTMFIGMPASQINDGYGRLVRSIAHELLHLANMPNHSVPTKPSDKFIVTMEECGFPSYW